MFHKHWWVLVMLKYSGCPKKKNERKYCPHFTPKWPGKQYFLKAIILKSWITNLSVPQSNNSNRFKVTDTVI